MFIEKIKQVLMLITASSLLISALPGQAHHSHAMFDADTEVILAGKVAGLRYANPHIRLLVELENDAGDVERWDIEMSTIVNMRGRGVTRSTFSMGDDITVTVNPLRDGGHGGNLVRIQSLGGIENIAEGGSWEPAS